MSDRPASRCIFDDKDLLLRMEMTIPGQVSAISPVVDGVLKLVEEMDCAAGKEFEVETALREALANAITHGCGGDPEKRVQVAVACDKSRGMLIVVRIRAKASIRSRSPAPSWGSSSILRTEEGST